MKAYKELNAYLTQLLRLSSTVDFKLKKKQNVRHIKIGKFFFFLYFHYIK